MQKAQIKMFETIAVLVVFFIIIMFGLMFYTRIQKGSFEAELEEKTIQRAIDMSENIFLLPEIECIHKKGCIDLLKLDAATEIINTNRIFYFSIFGNSRVLIQQIYPEQQQWNLYDFPKTEDRGKISTQFPIPVYDPKNDTYSFGVLYVDIYR